MRPLLCLVVLTLACQRTKPERTAPDAACDFASETLDPELTFDQARRQLQCPDGSELEEMRCPASCVACVLREVAGSRGVRHGVSVWWYVREGRGEVLPDKNGRWGHFITLNPSTVREATTYRHGQLHGVFSRWHESGSLAARGEICEGRESRPMRFWAPDGGEIARPTGFALPSGD